MPRYFRKCLSSANACDILIFKELFLCFLFLLILINPTGDFYFGEVVLAVFRYLFISNCIGLMADSNKDWVA